MIFVLTGLLCLFAFLFGRAVAVVQFRTAFLLLFDVITKIDQLCALKGKRISDLSRDELNTMIQQQVALRSNTSHE